MSELNDYMRALLGDFDLNEKQLEQLEIYCDFLIEYNEKVNLTAITEPKEIVRLHFFDSLAAVKLPELKEKAQCVDIGTGAGFPGVPLAIARQDINVCLVDSLKKRLVFLDELKEKTGLTNICTVHGRSEDLGNDKGFREKFDCAFSRAVARMNVLLEYDIPFVKCGGYALAWKGPQFYDELKDASNALKQLNAEVENVYASDIGGTEHIIAAIKKLAPTPLRFPRQAGTVKKKPL